VVTEDDFKSAVDTEPTLCGCGLASQFVRRHRTRHLRGSDFDSSRAEFLRTGFDEFFRAVDFLARCQLRRTPNHTRCGFSYHLKHVAERWAGAYISNGALIAAAIHLGIPFDRSDETLNVYLAVSSRCPMASERGVTV
jgi:hypothetical protein